MARRKQAAQKAPEIVDRDEMVRRFASLARRLRLSRPLEGPEYRQVEARIAAVAAQSDDPAERLGRLLDLADEMRVSA